MQHVRIYNFLDLLIFQVFSMMGTEELKEDLKRENKKKTMNPNPYKHTLHDMITIKNMSQRDLHIHVQIFGGRNRIKSKCGSLQLTTASMKIKEESRVVQNNEVCLDSVNNNVDKEEGDKNVSLTDSQLACEAELRTLSFIKIDKYKQKSNKSSAKIRIPVSRKPADLTYDIAQEMKFYNQTKSEITNKRNNHVFPPSPQFKNNKALMKKQSNIEWFHTNGQARQATEFTKIDKTTKCDNAITHTCNEAQQANKFLDGDKNSFENNPSIESKEKVQASTVSDKKIFEFFDNNSTSLDQLEPSTSKIPEKQEGNPIHITQKQKEIDRFEDEKIMKTGIPSDAKIFDLNFARLMLEVTEVVTLIYDKSFYVNNSFTAGFFLRIEVLKKKIKAFKCYIKNKDALNQFLYNSTSIIYFFHFHSNSMFEVLIKKCEENNKLKLFHPTYFYLLQIDCAIAYHKVLSTVGYYDRDNYGYWTKATALIGSIITDRTKNEEIKIQQDPNPQPELLLLQPHNNYPYEIEKYMKFLTLSERNCVTYKDILKNLSNLLKLTHDKKIKKAEYDFLDSLNKSFYVLKNLLKKNENIFTFKYFPEDDRPDFMFLVDFIEHSFFISVKLFQIAFILFNEVNQDI